MIYLTADTTRDQKIIDKFQRAYENLKKIVNKQNKKIRELEDQLNEYRKRHPSDMGEKNGRAYEIKGEKNNIQITGNTNSNTRN